MRSGMLIGFHVLSAVETGGMWGCLSSLFRLGGCCLVSVFVLFISLWCFYVCLCPYIHLKFPSIISDGRSYLRTKWTYGQSWVIVFSISSFPPFLRGCSGSLYWLYLFFYYYCCWACLGYAPCKHVNFIVFIL